MIIILSRSLTKRVIKFGLVGVFAALFNYLILDVLLSFQISHFLSYLISTGMAIFVSYMGNHMIVYGLPANEISFSKIQKFYSSYAVTIAAGSGVFHFLVVYCGLTVLISFCTVTLAQALVTFFIGDLLFRKR